MASRRRARHAQCNGIDRAGLQWRRVPPTANTTTRFASAAPRQTAETILPKLKKLDASFRARWFALFVAGALVSMIGPVIFGTAMFMREYRAGGVGIGDAQHSWLWHVGMVSLWFLPILFLIEWITRGKLLENTVEATSDTPRFIAGRAVAGAVFVEMCLWGPRMVTGGIRKQFGLTRLRHADRRLGAAMLAELVNRGEGLPIGELYVLAKNNDDAFAEAMAYLMFHDLADVSKSGDRVWLCSDGKRALGTA